MSLWWLLLIVPACLAAGALMLYIAVVLWVEWTWRPW